MKSCLWESETKKTQWFFLFPFLIILYVAVMRKSQSITDPWHWEALKMLHLDFFSVNLWLSHRCLTSAISKSLYYCQDIVHISGCQPNSNNGIIKRVILQWLSAVLLCSFWQSVMSVISCSLGGLIKFFHWNNQHSCSQPLCNYSNSLSASCENFLSYPLTSANQREKVHFTLIKYIHDWGR